MAYNLFYDEQGTISVDEDAVFDAVMDYLDVVQSQYENNQPVSAEAGIMPEVDAVLDVDEIVEMLADEATAVEIAESYTKDIVPVLEQKAGEAQQQMVAEQQAQQIEPLDVPYLPEVFKLYQTHTLPNLTAFDEVDVLLPLDEEKGLTDAEKDELLSYRVGAFSNTIEHADRINELARSAGLLPLDLETDAEQETQHTAFLDKLREYRELSSYDTFSDGLGNSQTTRAIVTSNTDTVDEAISLLSQASPEDWTGVLNQVMPDVERGMASLKNMLTTSYHQFGGKPDGDDHKNRKKSYMDIGLFG